MVGCCSKLDLFSDNNFICILIDSWSFDSLSNTYKKWTSGERSQWYKS